MYNAEIVASENISEDELESLRILYQTPIGTIPLEREKGIDTTYLSMPKEVAKNMYSVEIIKKTRLYSNNIEVSIISFSENEYGKITAKVVVSRGE